MARSPIFDQVDPGLLKLIQQVGSSYSPYRASITSAYRSGDPRYHGRGMALDVELLDPKTQTALANYQDPTTAAAYQAFANAVYQAAPPELKEKLRWGGYFSGGKGKYGALDLMHFDIGGGPGGTPMAGGSWSGGFTPEQAALWNMKPGGGIGTVAQNMAAAGYSPEQIRNAIASIESAGSGDYAALGPVTNRQGDRAYGRYQVMGSNVPAWTKQVLGKEMTPEQFLADPKAQDAVFDAIYGGYVKEHGYRGAASKWFTGSPNEPDVTDIGGRLTGKSYADKFMAALGETPTAVHPPNPTVGTGGYVKPGADTTPVPAAAKEKQPWWKKALADMAGADFGEVKKVEPNLPPIPGAAVTQLQPVPPININQVQLQRQQLAEALARLNSGKLFMG